MKYFEEMRTKRGFSDGNAIPEGVEEYRKVYIAAINKAAEKFDTKLEAYPYDRQGLHNHCLILFRPKGSTTDEEVELDEGMQDAINLCDKLYEIDDLLEVEVAAVDDFEEQLIEMITGAEV